MWWLIYQHCLHATVLVGICYCRTLYSFPFQDHSTLILVKLTVGSYSKIFKPFIRAKVKSIRDVSVPVLLHGAECSKWSSNCNTHLWWPQAVKLHTLDIALHSLTLPEYCFGKQAPSLSYHVLHNSYDVTGRDFATCNQETQFLFLTGPVACYKLTVLQHC